MTIHLILGRQGSGKTLYLVRKALECKNANKKVYANFHLNFKYNKIKYEDIINCKLTDCVTLLDEIHLILPARNSLSKTNRLICDNFLSMARKQNNEIYGTTQTARKVDVRFREEADYVYFCTKYAWDKTTGFWFEVYHDNMIEDNDTILIKIEIEEVYSGHVVSMAFMGNNLYSYFDTKQIVKIEGLDEAVKKKK